MRQLFWDRNNSKFLRKMHQTWTFFKKERESCPSQVSVWKISALPPLGVSHIFFERDGSEKEKWEKMCLSDSGKEGEDDSALYFPRFRKREIKEGKNLEGIWRTSCHVILISSFLFPRWGSATSGGSPTLPTRTAGPPSSSPTSSSSYSSGSRCTTWRRPWGSMPGMGTLMTCTSGFLLFYEKYMIAWKNLWFFTILIFFDNLPWPCTIISKYLHVGFCKYHFQIIILLSLFFPGPVPCSSGAAPPSPRASASPWWSSPSSSPSTTTSSWPTRSSTWGPRSSAPTTSSPGHIAVGTINDFPNKFEKILNFSVLIHC